MAVLEKVQKDVQLLKQNSFGRLLTIESCQEQVCKSKTWNGSIIRQGWKVLADVWRRAITTGSTAITAASDFADVPGIFYTLTATAVKSGTKHNIITSRARCSSSAGDLLVVLIKMRLEYVACYPEDFDKSGECKDLQSYRNFSTYAD